MDDCTDDDVITDPGTGSKLNVALNFEQLREQLHFPMNTLLGLARRLLPNRERPSSPNPDLTFLLDDDADDHLMGRVSAQRSATKFPPGRLSAERHSSPSQFFERHSEESEGGWNKLEQALEEKLGEEIRGFLINYGYLVVPSADGDIPVIPNILSFPHLRDRLGHPFTEDDIIAIRTFIISMINSLLDMKHEHIANRMDISKAIKNYRNVLGSYKCLRNSRIKNGKRKGAHHLPRDPSYKPSMSVKRGTRYKTRQNK